MVDMVKMVVSSLGDGIKDQILEIENETAKKLRLHIKQQSK